MVFLGRDGDPYARVWQTKMGSTAAIRRRVEEVLLFSRELLDLETDSGYVFPMCREDFERVRIVGQGFDRKLVADEALTKVI